MRVVVILAVVLVFGACSPGPGDGEAGGRMSVAAAMGTVANAGFARATTIRPFVFPEDHGPHEDFRTEWWYFTGNVAGEDGSQFGFQFTIFRHALALEPAERDSRWAARDVWFAHYALGDAASKQFRAFERFQRGALDLAGARARPFAAWVGDWRAESIDEAETFPMRLLAAEEGVALDLVVDLDKPIVLQGDRGLSQKGPQPGNASYYYSATRLTARGTVSVAGVEHDVTGSAWLDREWSTSALSEGQVGWDWFSIQLDDGRELMLYRLRREDGTTDPHDSGTLVEPDGTTHRLGPDDVSYVPGRRWQSPRGGASYPVEWSLALERLGLALEVVPMLDASELDVSVRYWEGAIRVRGRDRSGAVSGRGFLEMTGYEQVPQTQGDPTPTRQPYGRGR